MKLYHLGVKRFLLLIAITILCSININSQIKYPIEQGVYIFKTDDSIFVKLEKCTYDAHYFDLKERIYLCYYYEKDYTYASTGSSIPIYTIDRNEIQSAKIIEFRKSKDLIYVNEDDGYSYFGEGQRTIKSKDLWYLSRIKESVEIDNMGPYLKSGGSIIINDYVIGDPKCEYVNVNSTTYNISMGNYVTCSTTHYEFRKRFLQKVYWENGYTGIASDTFEPMFDDAFLYVIKVID